MKKFISVLIVIAMLSVTVLSVANSFLYNKIAFASDNDVYYFPESAFQSLNYEICWYGNDHTLKKEKTQNNYDKNKPTIIFVHGQEESNGHYARDVLYGKTSEGDIKFIAEEWLNLGYNVGEFFWNQIAADNIINGVNKIWTTEMGMRWRLLDGSYTNAFDDRNPNKAVAELFIESFLSAMSDYEGNEIRFVGHSMGTQVVTAGAYILSKMKNLKVNLMPERLALLDPYASNISEETYKTSWDKKSMNGKFMFELMSEYVEYLANLGVAFEVYVAMEFAYLTCYNMSQASSNQAMRDRGKFTYKRMFDNSVWVYLDGMNSLPIITNSGDQHIGARDYYFASYRNEIPIYDLARNYEIQGVSALTPTEIIYAMKSKTFIQYSNFTWTPSGDNFVEVTPHDKIEIEHRLPQGKICGRTFTVNSNGIADSVLNNINNIKVNLYQNQTLIASTTSKGGWYFFNNLNEGEYIVEFENNKNTEFYTENTNISNKTTTIKNFENGRTSTIILNSDTSIEFANAAFIVHSSSKTLIIILAICIPTALIISAIVFVAYKKRKVI